MPAIVNDGRPAADALAEAQARWKRCSDPRRGDRCDPVAPVRRREGGGRPPPSHRACETAEDMTP